MAYQIYLKKGEEKRIIGGHSWVYANEVAKIEGKDKNGALASVYSFDGKFIGKGYINHLSKILIRIFIRDEKEEDSDELFRTRLVAANDYRQKLGYENAYRMVFAEADDLPALIVDKYADYLAVQLLSLGMDKQRERIVRLLQELFSPKGIYERSDVAVRAKEGLEEKTGLLFGEVPDEIIIEATDNEISPEIANRLITVLEYLDEFIEDAYYLEVSSPGLGRTLKKDRHFEKSIGMEVDLKTYKPVEGSKEFTGTLKSFDKDTVTLMILEKEVSFSRKDIAKINLTLDF